MRVVKVREFGGPEVLRVEEDDAPEPGPGQVRIAVARTGVGFGDTLVRCGRYPFPLPYVPGLEVGGRVEAVGGGVDPELVGRTVVAATAGMTGGYAESALAQADTVHEVPEALALDRALAVCQAGTLAAGLLEAVGLRPQDSILITAAAGRIGSLLVQLAKTAGARVIAGVGDPAKTEAVLDLGADTVVCYADPAWTGQVRKATDGDGVRVVLDAVAGHVREQAIAAAASPGGRVGVYGCTGGGSTTLDAMDLGRRGLTVIGAAGIAFAKHPQARRADADAVLQAAAQGRLTARLHATYPLSQAPRAHADLELRRNLGAVLLDPGRSR